MEHTLINSKSCKIPIHKCNASFMKEVGEFCNSHDLWYNIDIRDKICNFKSKQLKQIFFFKETLLKHSPNLLARLASEVKSDPVGFGFQMGIKGQTLKSIITVEELMHTLTNQNVTANDILRNLDASLQESFGYDKRKIVSITDKIETDFDGIYQLDLNKDEWIKILFDPDANFVPHVFEIEDMNYMTTKEKIIRAMCNRGVTFDQIIHALSVIYFEKCESANKIRMILLDKFGMIYSHYHEKYHTEDYLTTVTLHHSETEKEYQIVASYNGNDYELATKIKQNEGASGFSYLLGGFLTTSNKSEKQE